MATFIQSVSNNDWVSAVSTFNALKNVSLLEQAATSSTASASSIVTLSATGAGDFLPSSATSQLQEAALSVDLLASGLTPAQQRQLALALGISTNATSTNLLNAINALLTPDNPAQQLINIVVGGATAETNPPFPFLLNAQGEIASVPDTSASQVSEAAFTTLLDLGTTAALNTIAATETQATTATAIPEAATATATVATSTTNETDTADTTTAIAEAMANAAAGLIAENTIPTAATLPATAETEGRAATAVAPAVAQTGTTAATIAATTAEEVAVSIVPPATTAPAVTAPVVNVPAALLTNTDSVLQALLANAAAHDLIAANQTAAAYSLAGTVQQLSSGVDHTRQADLRGSLPDIRDMINPVARVAAVRGALERQL